MRWLCLSILYSLTAWPQSAGDRLLEATKPPVRPGAEGEVNFERFLPLCLLVEPGAGSAERLAADLMIEAAKCGVYLEVGARYVSGIPSAPAALPQLLRRVRQRCDALEAFRDWGVTQASAAVVLRDPRFARALCDLPAEADLMACGEYARSPEGSILSRMASTGQGGKVAPSGQPAVALIAGGTQALRAIHTWAFGIALMGMPRGEGLGMGVGLADEGYAGAGSGSDLGWKPAGCAALRQVAWAVPGGKRWNPQKPLTQFDSRLLPLAGEENIFAKASPTPAQSAATPNPPRPGQGQRRAATVRTAGPRGASQVSPAQSTIDTSAPSNSPPSPGPAPASNPRTGLDADFFAPKSAPVDTSVGAPPAAAASGPVKHGK